MRTIIILSCLLVTIFAVQGPAPPVWPETFTQEFVQGDSKSKVYESGKLWYDIKNNRQRTDFSGSAFEPVCIALSQDPKTKCSILNTNNALYISLPEKSKCCKCCTAAEGCTIIPRDWLKDFVYSGEATLSGDTFYRWTLQGENYYATEDAARVPRRIDEGNFGLDFIMNTYTTDKIDDSVFTLSSGCNTPCPKNTGCLEASTRQMKAKTLREVLFGHKSAQEKKTAHLSK